MRVGVKTIADYTGVVQFRASGEMGGAYFIFNSAMAFVYCFFAADIYFKSDAGKSGQLSRDAVFGMLYLLCGFWVLTFAINIFIMKKEYRKSFFSAETGNEWAQRIFVEGKTDKTKSKTLKLNKNKWKKIRPEVKAWVMNNWFSWKEEKPEWFTDNWIAKVPDDMIPEDEDRAVLASVRRKSSVFNERASGRRLSSLLEGGGGGAVAPEIASP